MTEATLFKFPCDFPLKVMGRRSDDFRSIVLGIVQSVPFTTRDAGQGEAPELAARSDE